MIEKQKKIFAILYMVLKPIVDISIRTFYKRLTIVGKENMPKDDVPIMLISNHQNGMMDPILLCIIEKKQLHWLTRADIFQKPLISKILHAVNMLPVYRPKDKIPDSTERNEAIFKEAHRRIGAGNVISVFPEGNHGNKKRLRPIKTGPARIAFGAEETFNFELGLQIVPVGIDYSNYEKFRSDVLINYGKPIPVSQFNEQYKKDPIAAVKKFREVIHQAQSEVMIDIQDLDLYDTLMAIEKPAEELVMEHLNLKSSHGNEFKAFKYLTLQIENLKEEKKEDVEKLKQVAAVYKEELSRYQVNEKQLFSFGKKHLLDKVILIILFPLFLIGFLCVGGPFLLIKSYVHKNVQDPHFKSSIKVAMGGFGFLFYFIIIFVVLSVIFSAKIGFFGLIFVLVFGYFTLKYSDEYRRIKGIDKINKLTEKQWNGLLQKRTEIQEIIKKIL